MTPDIEWDESEGTSYGGVYHGREAIVSNVFPSEMARLDPPVEPTVKPHYDAPH